MHKLGLMRVANVILRGITLLSKFILIFCLAKFLEPVELGIYGLIVATVSYALYFLGFDFYIFTSREILKLDCAEWGGLLKSQVALSLLLYLIFLPLMFLIFINGLLPWKVIVWFFVLLILEHLNQEFGRLLVVISEQFTASLILFFRSGAWAICAAALMFLFPNLRELNFVLMAWSIGGGVAVFLSIYKLSRKNIGGWQKKVDWSWIVKGLKIAIPMLLATLALRGIFTLDRYWVQSLVGMDVLGAYVLFMGISGALMSFLDAGLFSFIYPSLINSFQRGNADDFRKTYKILMIQTVILTAIFIGISFLVIDPLLGWLGKSVYLNKKFLFYWVMAIMVIYAFSMIPHFGLYAQGRDVPLILSHVASFVVFVFFVWLLKNHLPNLAVPIGLCVSFGFMFIWKVWAFISLTPKEYKFN